MKLFNILIGAAILCVIVGIYFAIFVGPEGRDAKIVPCYDRYGNEIINATCIDDREDLANDTYLILIGFAFMLGILAFCVGAIEIINKKPEDEDEEE